MSKKNITFVIAVSWLFIAIGLIASKQYTLSTGKKVLLETTPVDPRDFLRGDYVVLGYKISTLDLRSINYRGNPAYPDNLVIKYGENIYIKLEQKEKYWEAVEIKEKKDIKTGDIVIKARVSYAPIHSHKLVVKYSNIEKYFVPEGQGKKIEKSMSSRKNKGSVEIIVDKSGNAVINRLFINDKEVKFD
ncbi:MAG: GDYXXLXY domain-containing protein [Elusimicrobia bacterium]|nr:GDYXXLXY domain-containing protein [Elusimicrobiota bacterium]